MGTNFDIDPWGEFGPLGNYDVITKSAEVGIPEAGVSNE